MSMHGCVEELTKLPQPPANQESAEFAAWEAEIEKTWTEGVNVALYADRGGKQIDLQQRF